jgi:hypothetical protein
LQGIILFGLVYFIYKAEPFSFPFVCEYFTQKKIPTIKNTKAIIGVSAQVQWAPCESKLKEKMESVNKMAKAI